MNGKHWNGFFVGMAVWLLMAPLALADVKVTSVELKPRYPWKGLVDIVYSVTCDEIDSNAQPFEVRVEFEGYDAVLDKTIKLKTLTGDGVGVPIKLGEPNTTTWNAAKDYPTINTAAFKVKIHACVPLYMVVDLSEGPNANSYPVRYTGEAPNLDDDTCRTTELWLRRISPGKFTMGSPAEEMGRSNEELQHEVTITKSFYIGVFECTQKQWQLVTGGGNFYFSGNLKPVESKDYASIHDTFCGKLKSKTGLSFDLPTEAQWEYACRAGTTTSHNSGKNLADIGNDPAMNGFGHYNSGMHEKVGIYKPNAWGLYDMHGNVKEFCSDWYNSDYYSVSPAEDPTGPTTAVNEMRLKRGGGYASNAAGCRSACRESDRWGSGNRDVGFRVFCRP